jgi:hypothetical protein
MMRRRFESRIPGEDVVITRMMAEQLDHVLDTLFEREAGVLRMTFGLADGRPRSQSEIATFYGVSTERIRQIQAKTTSKLRHESRSGILRYYLDGNSFPALDRIRIHNLAGRGLVQCPRHGWVDRSSERICPCCPCPLREPTERGGRRQLYCSGACRQMAHRQRRAASAS